MREAEEPLDSPLGHALRRQFLKLPDGHGPETVLVRALQARIDRCGRLFVRSLSDCLHPNIMIIWIIIMEII